MTQTKEQDTIIFNLCVCLCINTSKEQVEFAMKNNIICISIQRKWNGINLTNGVHDLYEEKQNTGEWNQELNKWREISLSWIERLHVVKMSVLSNLICRVSAVPIKIPTSYLVNASRHFKVSVVRQKTQNSQHNIEGE